MSDIIPRRVRRLDVEALESRQVLSAMLGLTTADTLVSFDSSRPDLLRSATSILGLQPGEVVRAIDSRAATGQVYGLGSTGRIYTLDPNSGAASLVSNGPIAIPLSGTSFDIDFRSGSSVLRIVSEMGQDLRYDVDSGILAIDANLAYATTDPGAATIPIIVGEAYNNNTSADQAGTLFAIDAKRSSLVIQDDRYGASDPSQNSGRLTTFQPLGLNVVGPVGFEFTADGEPLLSMSAPNGSGSVLYTLARNGFYSAPSLIGNFPASVTIRDITSLPTARTVYGVTTANSLISFGSATPGTLLSNHPILGLSSGEAISALAFRPATGSLYGFGSRGRLYTIETATGRATAVSTTPISPAYDGSKPSIDFVAGVDRIRLVTKSGQNLQINPDLGVVDEVDDPLTYGPADPASGFAPSVVTETQAVTTDAGTTISLFGIDSVRDTLVMQDTSPLSGKLTTIGPLGRQVTENAGLDTSFSTSGTTITLASLTAPSATTSTLYRIIPRSAAGSNQVPLIALGTIAGGYVVKDLAISPPGAIGFLNQTFAVSENVGTASITVVRTGGSSGPIQVHFVSSDGSAQAGVDYTPVNGFLSFGDGEIAKTFSVPIRSGSFATGSRTVNLTLSVDSVIETSIAKTVLTIEAPEPTLTPGIASANFVGSATAINAVDVTFNGPVAPILAANSTYFTVQGITADHTARTFLIPISAAIYDPATLTTHLVLSAPVALSSFRTLQVTAAGFNSGGTDASVSYSVQRGVSVHYLDADGDRVFLTVIGRKAKLIVLRRADGGAVLAWVEGNGRIVTGFILPRRGSNFKTTIARFVTNGAKLKLVKRITVRQLVIG